jgi:hypothetical protein
MIKNKKAVNASSYPIGNFYTKMAHRKYKEKLFGFPILREKLVLIMIFFAHIIVPSIKVGVREGLTGPPES